MFEARLEAAIGSPADLVRLAGDTHDELKVAGCRKLVIAAAWADAHSAVEHPDGAAGNPMRVERLVAMGPVGCPLVAETCPASLALAFQTSIGGAKRLIGDALNLRHRLPRTWQRVTAGQIHAWKARELAQRTGYLNPMRAREVDRLLAGHLELVAWRRFEKMLDATLLHVDEASYQQRARQAATHRDVWATQSSDGHRSLIARADAGDVTVFLALVNRIADALADDGDEDPVGARRAKAIGIAGYPDRALDLLLRHHHDPDTQQHPEERTDPSDPSDPWPPEPCPAGWATEQHGNYHQPTSEDPTDTDSAAHRFDGDEPETRPELDRRRRQTRCPETARRGRARLLDGALRASSGHQDRRWANSGGINLPAALAVFSKLDPATLAKALVKARPQVVIHLHLTDEAVATGRGVVRSDHGPITVDQLRRFLGDTGGDITVRPVLDPASTAAVDSYEIPIALRRAMAIRTPGSVFPYSPTLTGVDRISGRSSRTDLDHTDPYRRGGPPDQTGPGKLGPLARGEHRTRTVGDWSVRQPDPGTYLWRTPEGWIAITTNQGTLVLGDTSWATAIWHAARQHVAKAA